MPRLLSKFGLAMMVSMPVIARIMIMAMAVDHLVRVYRPAMEMRKIVDVLMFVMPGKGVLNNQ